MNSSTQEKKRWTITERLDIDQAPNEWFLSKDLFGNNMIDVYDFEPANYNYFLDRVTSLADLIKGLQELSPLADDALSAAEKMNERDFQLFKASLTKERTHEIGSAFPKRFYPLIMPKKFISATIIAEKYEVCLGVALIQLAKIEQQKNPG